MRTANKSYLRQIFNWCDASHPTAFPLALLLAVLLLAAPVHAGRYVFSVEGTKTLLNGQEVLVKGLRCSNALISDESTAELIGNLDASASYGVNTISVYFMGSRFGDVKGYNEDGSLNPNLCGSDGPDHRRGGRARHDRPGRLPLLEQLEGQVGKLDAERGQRRRRQYGAMAQRPRLSQRLRGRGQRGHGQKRQGLRQPAYGHRG